MIEVFGKKTLDNPVPMFYLMPISGFLLMCVNFRKIEYVRFKNNSGVPTLAIGKAGKEKKKFDAFINELKTRIENVQAPKNAA